MKNRIIRFVIVIAAASLLSGTAFAGCYPLGGNCADPAVQTDCETAGFTCNSMTEICEDDSYTGPLGGTCADPELQLACEQAGYSCNPNSEICEDDSGDCPKTRGKKKPKKVK